MNNVQWEVIWFTPAMWYTEWVLGGGYSKHHVWDLSRPPRHDCAAYGVTTQVLKIC